MLTANIPTNDAMHDPARYRPTERFGERATDYARARPGYPPELIVWLLRETGLARGDTVAELGSGTGLFTRELLGAGLRVCAVEPNAPMRALAEQAHRENADFVSVDGCAEATGLPATSLRLIAAAQAFHWFDAERTRAECRRLLQPGGAVALIWNLRRLDSPFARAYEDLLLRQCPDYAAGQPHQASPREIETFFAAPARIASFPYQQRFDFDGLSARLLSSSYTPKADDPRRAPLLVDLRALFDRHQRAGRVDFDYDTRAHLGVV